MKFKFSLEAVLRHRKILEDLAEKDLREVQALLVSEQNILEDMIHQKLEARRSSYQQHQSGGLPAKSLEMVDSFVLGQDFRIEKQRKKITLVENKVEELREILRVRAIDYKIVERLKEKKGEEFRIELAKQEQKIMDEMALSRFQGRIRKSE